MKLWNRYHIAETIGEALDLLHENNGKARLIAGGTDLLLDIQQGRRPPAEALIDISAIPDLQVIKVEDEDIVLGSAVTHRMILESQLLSENAACLIQACKGIGGSQVRNVATIGGNVAHALPAGDGSIALLALDARAKIVTKDGERWEHMEDLFDGPGKPSFDPCDELLASFRFPVRQPDERTAFHRVMRPQGVAIAILNMAIWLRMSAGSRVDDVRIAVGPAGPIPYRARETEKVLIGRDIEEDVISQATAVLQQESKLRTSEHRATIEYRRHLLGYLLRKTISV